MKILHTSDLHLASPLTSRLDPRLARIRRRELLSSFERLTEAATRENCSAFIIAGDLFDSARINESARLRVVDTIERKKDLTFIYLPGNHEKNAFLCGKLPENLKVFSEDGWSTFEVGDTAFHGTRDSRAGMFRGLSTVAGKRNVAVLHGELRASGQDAIIISEAKDKGLDYIALGHYHTYSETKIDEGCVAVYSGTPEGRGFDEVGELGYVIIDTNTLPVSHKFIKSATRTLHDITVDIERLSKTLEVEEKVRAAVSHVEESDLVRIRISGRRELDFKPDLSAIHDRFSNRFFHLDLKDETRLLISKDAFKYDKSLKGEFIRLVLSDDSIEQAERERIIEFGIRALMGESPDEDTV